MVDVPKEQLTTTENFTVDNGFLNRKLVIDSGAFISGIRFEKFGNEYYTIPQVIEEVKDPKARAFMESLSIDIKTRNPSKEAYDAVCSFARKTGDYPALSKVDLLVLALVYTLEKEAKGTVSHLKTEPMKIKVENSRIKTEVYLPSKKSDGNEEKKLIGFGEYDSDDDEGWITEENVEEYTKGLKGIEEEKDDNADNESDVLVSCMTTDFAMQNVLLQMGLHLTSVDGVAIKSLKQWILRCFSCYKLCTNMEKIFCPECGNNTLQRVQCTVDKDGNIVVNKSRRKINKRGTIYSIPLPKGGRKSKHLILSEDHIPKHMQTKKKNKSTLNDDVLFGPQTKNKTIVVGYGRKNPNEPRKRIGKKNKSRRIMGT